jgi:uncharacterized protein
MLYNDLKNYIKEKCLAPENLFQPAFFDLHLKYVENYALQLAKLFNADKDVVSVAAITHDLAAITDFSKLAQHASEGAIMVHDILADYPLTLEQKDKVYHCIETHSKPIHLGEDIPEAVCLSNADAMSQIAVPSYWMFYAFSVRKFSFLEGYDWYKQRVTNNWLSIVPEASDIIYDSYLKTILLFNKN